MHVTYLRKKEQSSKTKVANVIMGIWKILFNILATFLQARNYVKEVERS